MERDLIQTRTVEGRCRAKTRGKQMGRPPALTPVQQKEATSRCVPIEEGFSAIPTRPTPHNGFWKIGPQRPIFLVLI